MLRFVTNLGIIRFYNWCQERQYHKNVTTLTRFDQMEATGDDQMKTTANDQMKTTAREEISVLCEYTLTAQTVTLGHDF